MSKYVRTEDEIMTNEKRQEMITCAREMYGFKTYDIPIVKEADTIQKLCDVFVIHTRYDKYKIRTKWEAMREYVNIQNILVPGFITEVYGAIWTKWGLKYVARLNKEKELELI